MTSDPLEALYQKLSDGESIDWAHWQQQHPALAEQIGRMARLEAIARFHRGRHKPLDEHSWDTAPAPADVLFEWGHLSVLAAIGEGSFGEVYRAHDPVLNRTVALKLLKKNVSDDLHAQRFIQEARRLAKVRHRHVLAVHGAQIHNGRAGLWADDIDGASLTHRALADAPCSKAFWLKIAGQLCDALTAVHGAGLVHGDVKPANVMLDEHGEVVLMDFGAGHELHEGEHAAGVLTGTPLLMAPELFSGGAASQASDVYALGALLFKLACGVYPVRGNSLAELHRHHQHGERDDRALRRSPLPHALRRLVLDMLAALAEARPDAHAIRVRLNHALAAPQRRVRRILTASLLLGTAVSSIGFYQANRARDAAEVALQNTDAVNLFLSNMISSGEDLGEGLKVRVVDMLDYAARHSEDEFAAQPAARAEILHALGRAYNSLGQHKQALQQLQKAERIQRELYPPHHRALLTTLLSQSSAHSDLQQNEESLALAQTVVAESTARGAAWKQLLNRARALEIGSLLSLSRLDEAEALLQQQFGDLDPQALANEALAFSVMHLRASMAYMRGEYAQAIDMFRAELEWLDQRPQTHPVDRITGLEMLAISLVYQGHMREAVAVHEEVLAIKAELYGTDTVLYLRSLMNLGSTQYQINDLDASDRNLETALELSERLFHGPSEIRMTALLNLSNNRVARGDVRGGEDLLRQALEQAYAVYTDDAHLNILKTEYNLAELLNNTERYTEAEDWARRNHEKMQHTLGENHVFTLLAADNLAIALRGQDKLQAALELHNALLQRMQQDPNAHTVNHLLVQQHALETRHRAGQGESALQDMQSLLPQLRALLGDDHPQTRGVVALLQQWQNTPSTDAR